MKSLLFLILVISGWMIWGAVPGAHTTADTGLTNAAAPPESPPRSREAFLTFGLDRLDRLQYPIFGNPLWQYVASLIYLLLAFYFSKLLDLLIRVWLKRWAKKTETKFDDYFIELVRGPIKVVTFVILLHIGLRIFPWPAWFNIYVSTVLKIVVAASITYVALKFVDLLMNYWRDRAVDSDQALNAQLHPLLGKTLKIFIVLVAILVTSQNLGINITGILASFSVGALAVGLAAQDTLANLFGAVAIYLDHPFKIGDRIKLDTVDGTVETIGLRSTRVRNLDGFLVTIPNKTVGNATITNVAQRPSIKTTLTIGLTYETTTAQLKQAIEILHQIFQKHPMTQDVWVTFQEFGASSLNLQVVHWWKGNDYRAYLRGIQELNLAVKQQFDDAGLSMAYPTQTVYFKPDSGLPTGLRKEDPPGRRG